MIDDKKKKEIENTFFTAFDRWGELYFQNLFKTLKSGSDKEKREAYQKAFEEQSFLERRALNPGFYRYILKEMIDNSVIKRQRRILLKACLDSVATGAGMKIGDILEKASLDFSIEEYDDKLKNDKNGDKRSEFFAGYVRRSMQRFMHDRYQETFFEITDTIKSSKKTRGGKTGGSNPDYDEQVKYFASIFTPFDLPLKEESKDAGSYLALNRMKVMSDTYHLYQVYHHSILRFAMPEFLEDLLRFQKECEEVLIELGLYTDIASHLRSELAHFSDLLCFLYSHLTSILALGYFRHRKPEGKMILLQQDFPLEYSVNDAGKAHGLLSVLVGSDSKLLLFFLHHGAQAFLAFDLPDCAVMLNDQCKNAIGLSPLQAGICCENNAVLYREKQMYRLMLRHANEALANFKAAGDIYLVCLALRDIGEAQWMLGFKELAVKHFEQSEAESNKLDNGTKRADVLGNIAFAFRRSGDSKMELKYLGKCLATLPEEETEKIINVNARIAELSRYL